MNLFELEFSSFPNTCPGVKLLDYMAVLFLFFQGISMLISTLAVSTTFPPAVYRISFSPHLVIPGAFDDGHPDRHEALSHCGFGLQFLMIGDAEHPFMCLLAICVSSWKNGFHVFCSYFSQVCLFRC